MKYLFLIFAYFGLWKLKIKNLDYDLNFETGYGAMDTKNEVRIANYFIFQNFIKKGKRGKRGMIYLNSWKKIDFDQFSNFLLPFQIYPFWYFFYPFFRGGQKVQIFVYFPHKYLKNWSNSKKVIRIQNLVGTKTTNFVNNL